MTKYAPYIIVAIAMILATAAVLWFKRVAQTAAASNNAAPANEPGNDVNPAGQGPVKMDSASLLGMTNYTVADGRTRN